MEKVCLQTIFINRYRQTLGKTTCSHTVCYFISDLGKILHKQNVNCNPIGINSEVCL